MQRLLSEASEAKDDARAARAELLALRREHADSQRRDEDQLQDLADLEECEAAVAAVEGPPPTSLSPRTPSPAAPSLQARLEDRLRCAPAPLTASTARWLTQGNRGARQAHCVSRDEACHRGAAAGKGPAGGGSGSLAGEGSAEAAHQRAGRVRIPGAPLCRTSPCPRWQAGCRASGSCKRQKDATIHPAKPPSQAAQPSRPARRRHRFWSPLTYTSATPQVPRRPRHQQRGLERPRHGQLRRHCKTDGEGGEKFLMAHQFRHTPLRHAHAL